MTRKTHTFKAQFIREFPDPVEKGAKHYILLCEARSVPKGLSLAPNPRKPNMNLMVAKEVRESLAKDDSHFHLKNKGITLLAKEVRVDKDKTTAETDFLKSHGIVDGGHTYAIIQKLIEDKDIPEKQFVKIEILTNISEDYFTDIAGGLNTSLQVADHSLENLKQHFDWIKEETKGEVYEKDGKIIYHENDSGVVSIKEIIALIHMFLPNEDGSQKKEQPKIAYGQKKKCLDHFRKFRPKYEEMRPIFKDILELHDYILYNACEKYNLHVPKGKASLLRFMNKKKQSNKKPPSKYPLVFMNKTTEYRMDDGALYPILGAFRYLVEKQDGVISWKVGGINEVKACCDSLLGQMIESTRDSMKGRNIDAVGKDGTHWDNLYKTVALEFETSQNN